MRAVITGDWHIGLTTHGIFDPVSGMNSRLIDIKNAASEIVLRAKQLKADFFFHLGDLFHTNHPTPTEIAVAYSLLNELDSSGIKTIVLSGNHDFVQGKKLDPIEMFGVQNWKHVRCFSKPEIVMIANDEIRLIIVPHCSMPEWLQFFNEGRLQIPQDGKLNVLLCHTTFYGAQVGSEDRMLAAGVNMLAKDLNVHVVFSGHIHKPQKLVSSYSGRVDVYYPGSPIQMDFAERNDQKEFLVCDTDKMMFSVSEEKIKSSRKLIQIDSVDYEKWGDVSGAIVKAVIKKSESGSWTAEDVERVLKDAGAFHVVSVQFSEDNPEVTIVNKIDSKKDADLMWQFLQSRLGSDAEAGWYEAQEVIADVRKPAC